MRETGECRHNRVLQLPQTLLSAAVVETAEPNGQRDDADCREHYSEPEQLRDHRMTLDREHAAWRG